MSDCHSNCLNYLIWVQKEIDKLWWGVRFQISKFKDLNVEWTTSDVIKSIQFRAVNRNELSNVCRINRVHNHWDNISH